MCRDPTYCLAPDGKQTAPMTKQRPVPSADSGEVGSHRQHPMWAP